MLDKNLKQILPNDAMNEIISQLKTYDQSLVCHINKQIKCNNNVKILLNNINYKPIAIGLSKFIIHNNKLYTNTIINNNYISELKNFVTLETPGIPLKIVSHNYDLLVLTSTGLYVRKFIKTSNIRYFTDYIKLDVDDFISFYINDVDVYVSTPNYITIFSVYDEILTQKNINIKYCLGFLNYNDEIYYWTKDGLYYIDKVWGKTFINIDDDNDILDISYITYNEVRVLTTTGLYKNISDCSIWSVKLSNCTFKLINTSNIKHISGVYILTTKGELLKNNKLIMDNILYMQSYRNNIHEYILVETKNNEYFYITDSKNYTFQEINLKI